MKIPEQAPDWYAHFKDNDKCDKIFNKPNIEKLNNFVRKIEQGEEYIYWDKIKHMRTPEDISSEMGWAYLKFSRQSKINKIPLLCQEKKQFGFWTPDSILKNLSFIDRQTGGEILIEKEHVPKSEKKKYLISSLMEEAIASSLLEGAATTRKAAKKLLRTGRTPRNRAEQMVYNNYQTIVKIKKLLKYKLNDKLLLELHRSMTIDTLDNPDECGRFRTMKDDKIYVRSPEGQLLYEPPEASAISPMLKDLYEFANNETSEKYIHPVIRAVTLHFYLSYTHPFMDGNGRTARALFYWYILKHNYWMFEYLTISKIFLSAPARYARAFLYTEIDDLDLTYFISFHLRTIRIAINKLLEYIKAKQKEERDAVYLLRKFPEFNDRQKSLLKHALQNKNYVYSINEHKSFHNVTYESARKDLLDLQKKGIFIKSKKGKEYVFTTTKELAKKIRKKTG